MERYSIDILGRVGINPETLEKYRAAQFPPKRLLDGELILFDLYMLKVHEYLVSIGKNEADVTRHLSTWWDDYTQRTPLDEILGELEDPEWVANYYLPDDCKGFCASAARIIRKLNDQDTILISAYRNVTELKASISEESTPEELRNWAFWHWFYEKMLNEEPKAEWVAYILWPNERPAGNYEAAKIGRYTPIGCGDSLKRLNYMIEIYYGEDFESFTVVNFKRIKKLVDDLLNQ